MSSLPPYFVRAVAVLTLLAACGRERPRPAERRDATASAAAPSRATVTPGATYAGACDISAAVLAAPGVALVASDEDDVIRAYTLGDSVARRDSLDLTPLLSRDGARDEADLEGAARIGDTVYWIGSQSRDKRRALVPNRRQLVATIVRADGDRLTISPLGRPYRGLLTAMLRAPALDSFALAASSRRAAEDAAGLNVEGLAATPDGRLLLGFRNPVPDRRALVVPIENPAALVRSDTATPRFGAPLRLDLGGLGIRDIVYWPARGVYVISAGAPRDSTAFRLYTWAGGDAPPIEVVDLSASGLTPEAVLVPDPAKGDRLVLLSDDGDRDMGGARCKDLKAAGHASAMRFRSATVTMP